MNARMLLLPVVAAAMAFALWKSNASSAAPACTWRTGTGVDQGANFGKLAPEAPVRLPLHADAPLRE